jgi:Ca2+/Na+ antiporter
MILDGKITPFNNMDYILYIILYVLYVLYVLKHYIILYDYMLYTLHQSIKTSFKPQNFPMTSARSMPRAFRGTH